MEEEKSKNAIKYVKENKKLLKSKFIECKKIRPNKRPVFMFMAGSPGAGKTEFSKKLIEVLEKNILKSGIARIDADDIRNILPDYTGKNSHIFQKACSKGVEILFDYVSHKKYNAIIDGTFSHYKVASKNIKRVVDKGCDVYIVYKYLDPITAWGFTKLREKEEGRKITKQVFIESFYQAKENVNKIKKVFRDKVNIWIVISDILGSDGASNEKIKFDVDNIDNHLETNYNIKDLKRILKV
jgi:predicted ABC-type ATPase